MNSATYGGTPPSVETYLASVDSALRDLPRSRRRELVADLRSHLEAELAGRPNAGDAEIASMLDELGTPADIAEAARAELPVPDRRLGLMEIAAIVLLTIGAVVMPVVGWVVGVVLLWASPAWRTGDKLLGTFVVPGGRCCRCSWGSAPMGGTPAARPRWRRRWAGQHWWWASSARSLLRSGWRGTRADRSPGDANGTVEGRKAPG